LQSEKDWQDEQRRLMDAIDWQLDRLLSQRGNDAFRSGNR